jgi:hypothetical protein
VGRRGPTAQGHPVTTITEPGAAAPERTRSPGNDQTGLLHVGGQLGIPRRVVAVSPVGQQDQPSAQTLVVRARAQHRRAEGEWAVVDGTPLDPRHAPHRGSRYQAKLAMENSTSTPLNTLPVSPASWKVRSLNPEDRSGG